MFCARVVLPIGSSPRARGTQAINCFGLLGARVIPACAGNTA